MRGLVLSVVLQREVYGAGPTTVHRTAIVEVSVVNSEYGHQAALDAARAIEAAGLGGAQPCRFDVGRYQEPHISYCAQLEAPPTGGASYR
ncbi:MAG: hypothetical protein M0008_14715 [Actinomycetota bacterium]|nr:hypothetical protein [Actinomycetota bacterium]